MKSTIKIALRTGLVALWLVAAILVFSGSVQAKPPSAVDGAVFNVSQSLNDNLKFFTGKDVVIHLRSGKSFQGYVKSVGDHFVHLEKLAGKDFYDALIRIEDISSMEARFREMK
jgi:hypothetical protein